MAGFDAGSVAQCGHARGWIYPDVRLDSGQHFDDSWLAAGELNQTQPEVKRALLAPAQGGSFFYRADF